MATTLAPSQSMELFIRAVRDRMTERRITGVSLSAKARISRAGLSELLNGRGGSCSLATADAIASALETTTIDLLLTGARLSEKSK